MADDSSPCQVQKTELPEGRRWLHKEGTGQLSTVHRSCRLPTVGVRNPIYSLQIGQWEQLDSFNMKSVFKFFCGV